MKLPITEQLYTKSKPIDKLQTLKAINLILDEQEKASFSVREIVHEIDKAIGYAEKSKYPKQNEILSNVFSNL